MDELRLRMLDAVSSCDIVVSSGGVSAGIADFIKPLLGELGTIRFSKLDMKPGKPTTFATVQAGDKKALYFGLPGNPVSCLVTKALLVDPAVRRLQVMGSRSCLAASLLRR
jgi:molybdopterin biosynthesis enzyme